MLGVGERSSVSPQTPLVYRKSFFREIRAVFGTPRGRRSATTIAIASAG
jgi:hypothetical protein